MAGIAGILFLARANAAQAVDTIGYEFDSDRCRGGGRHFIGWGEREG